MSNVADQAGVDPASRKLPNRPNVFRPDPSLTQKGEQNHCIALSIHVQMTSCIALLISSW